MRQCKCNIFQINLTRLQWQRAKRHGWQRRRQKISVICIYRKQELDIYACAATPMSVNVDVSLSRVINQIREVMFALIFENFVCFSIFTFLFLSTCLRLLPVVMYFMDLWFNELVRRYIGTVEERRKRQYAEERQQFFFRQLGFDWAFTKIKALLIANPISNSLCLNSNVLFGPLDSMYDLPDYRAYQLPEFHVNATFSTSHTSIGSGKLHEKAQNYSKKANKRRKRQRNENDWRRTHKMFEERTNAYMRRKGLSFACCRCEQ